MKIFICVLAFAASASAGIYAGHESPAIEKFAFEQPAIINYAPQPQYKAYVQEAPAQAIITEPANNYVFSDTPPASAPSRPTIPGFSVIQGLTSFLTGAVQGVFRPSAPRSVAIIQNSGSNYIESYPPAYKTIQISQPSYEYINPASTIQYIKSAPAAEIKTYVQQPAPAHEYKYVKYTK